MESPSITHPTSTIFEDLLGYPDERSLQYPFMDSAVPSTCLVLLYIYFVKFWGPKYMETRSPFNLKSFILAFNLFVLGINGYIFVTVLSHNTNFNFICEPMKMTDAHTNKVMPVGYIFVVMKYIELLDTVFFVLRKKNNLVTFLHLFHHISIPLLGYISFKYYPGGPMIFATIVNSFVHLIMYSYYFMATLGPQFKRYLWWKRYLTLLQMLQLLAGTMIGLPSVFGYCAMPKVFRLLYLTYGPVLLVLFGNYYIQTYIRRHSSKPKEH